MRESVIRLEEQLKAHKIALDLSKEEMNRRLEGLNELRNQVVLDRSEFVKQETYSEKIDSTDKWCITTDKRLTTVENKTSFATILAVVIIVAEIILKMFESKVFK